MYWVNGVIGFFLRNLLKEGDTEGKIDFFFTYENIFKVELHYKLSYSPFDEFLLLDTKFRSALR
jgi:hypothetical protein